MAKGIAVLFLLAVVGISLLVIGVSTTYSVPISNVGILVNSYSGEVSGPIAGPTTQFFQKYPWVNLITISTSVQTITLEGNATGVFVLSSDNLEIEFDVNFRYQVNGNSAIQLYRNFPSQNWQDAAIIPHIRAAFRDVVSHYPADEIASTARAAIQSGVENQTIFQIGNDTSLAHAINVVSTQITDITLPLSFLQAIQNKLTAQQALLQAQFQAQTQITLAEGSANSTIAQARGTAEAVRIQASGVANATIIEANATSRGIDQILTQAGITNSTQRANIITTYLFMQQLQVLCAETNNPCQNMILFVGGQNGQIFELPVGTTKP